MRTTTTSPPRAEEDWRENCSNSSRRPNTECPCDEPPAWATGVREEGEGREEEEE